MIWSAGIDPCLFVAAVTGMALPWLPLLRRWNALERLSLAIGSALILGYLVLFGLYTAGLALQWFWLLPVAGLLFVFSQPDATKQLLADPAVTRTVGRWMLLAGWCLGWHALIFSYSGGGWGGDWIEHYQRAHFFLQRWPTSHLFLGLYPMPSRPPLGNLWMAGLMSGSRGAFFHYQMFATLLSTLVFFPLAALVAQWRASGGASHAQALLLVVLMTSPLFLQNATFPWTKLPTAFFVVLAASQLMPGAGGQPAGRLLAGSLALTAGMLTHYSAGPWICALALAWLTVNYRRFGNPALRTELALAAAWSGLLFATWLVWAVANYGVVTTFTANTTLAMAPGGDVAERLMRAAANLWYTFIPVSPSTVGPGLMKQANLMAGVRDTWFTLYQLKLTFAFGSLGGAALLWLLARQKPSPGRRFWWTAAPAAIVVGVGTHSRPDELGLTHIALQPLVLLALAWLAASAAALPRWLGRLWIAGLVLDLALGVVLHFGVQTLNLERWLQPGDARATLLQYFSTSIVANYEDKVLQHLTFLADGIPHALALGLILTTGGLALAGLVAAKSGRASAGM